MPDLELVAVALGQSPADLVIRGGNLVNVFTEEIYPADVAVYGSKIAAVGDVSGQTGPDTKVVDASGLFLVPGLIDGHLHVECSKLSVTMFANAVVPRGTTSIVSGLDQIFVVAGLEGVREFLDEAALGPLGVFWGAPSKLPYTFPESTVGHTFGPEEHAKAQGWPECVGLWETVQEFVFERDPKVMEAMDMAQRNRLPVFSCAPLAEGAKIAALACAGFRADHECYSAEETLAKLRNGLYVMIRESSVAHFLAENLRVITEHKAKADRIGFCTDDVTATDILSQGHLDHLVRMAIEQGLEPMRAIQMATINCAQIYRIDQLAGSISPGRVADVLMIDDPSSFRVRRVVAKGKLVAEDGQMIVPARPPARSPGLLHTISVERVEPADLQLRADPQATSARVLSMAMSDEVPFVRKRREVELEVTDGVVLPDVERDVLYVTVVERYGKSSHRPVAFVSGFGLKAGAMASSASPDDNNILCIGTNPKDMATAINHLAAEGGGQVVVRDGEVLAFLSLPIAGIVADLPPQDMALMEAQLDEAARSLGCRLASPFMYLIFLSITAIPDYAITDLGLIDCVTLEAMSPLLEQTPS
ncbi:MAG: adenine deaminase [Streptosporangiaceae bacterium]